jgi:hypothetical protein
VLNKRTALKELKMKIKSLLASAFFALGLGAAAGAHAALVNGSINFSDGFEATGTSTSIVSELNAINVGGQALAQNCVGDFPPPGCFVLGNYAFDFDLLGGGGQLVFSYAGFTFTVNSFDPPVRTSLSCDMMGNCSDALDFTAHGTVTGNGFDPTAFLLIWSANATCTQNVINPPVQCVASTISAGWTATITANGQPGQVPEPGTLALIGIGLACLGLLIRVRRT